MKIEELYRRGKCVASLEYCVVTYSLVLDVTENYVKTLDIVKVPNISDSDQAVTASTRCYHKSYLQAKLDKYPQRYKRCDLNKNPEIRKLIKNALDDLENARTEVMQVFFPQTSRVGVQL